MNWFATFSDWVTQRLTSAPMWVQFPLVLIVAVALAGLMAWVLLKAIDTGSALASRWLTVEKDSEPGEPSD